MTGATEPARQTDRALRILFVNSFYAPEIGGGAELTLHRMARGLVAGGDTIAAFTTGEAETIDDVDGVTVYRFPIDNAFRKLSRDLPGKVRRVIWQWRDRASPLMAARLDTVIKAFQPDIVQFHNLSGITRSVWAVPRAHGIPGVQVLHDLYLICPNSSMFRRGSSCKTQCTSCAMFRRGFAVESERVDGVVGVSRYVVDRVRAAGYFRTSLARVIYNAQEFPAASPLVGDEEVRFGFIGALTQAKGVEWLIDQFNDTMGTLTIAGTGEADYVAALKARAAGKRISFLGHVPSAEYFPGIDVGIVPSIWNDTLPGVAIEGCAHGRAMIVSRRGGLPEIVRDGETGLLVDPDRPETLGAAMRSLAADRSLLARMAAAAPAAIGVFTDFGRFLDSYRAFSKQLMNGARSAEDRRSGTIRWG